MDDAQGAGVGSKSVAAIPSLDWGIGSYEITAAQLLPAADAVVRSAGLTPNETVLDLGCGTGNAALLAAKHAGRVIGVDPAPRLLEVARHRAASDGHEIEFLPGDAASLPLDDASIDVVLSVFAVIFAPDPGVAAAEMARVLAPNGRMVLSAWIPGGPISDMNGVAAEAVAQALGMPPGPKPFPWHDLAALTNLLSPHGLRVAIEERQLAFTASSAEDYFEHESNHPMALAGRAVLEQSGQAEAVRDRMLAVLKNGNEAPEAFRATSRYIIATAHR